MLPWVLHHRCRVSPALGNFRPLQILVSVWLARMNGQWEGRPLISRYEGGSNLVGNPFNHIVAPKLPFWINSSSILPRTIFIRNSGTDAIILHKSTLNRDRFFTRWPCEGFCSLVDYLLSEWSQRYQHRVYTSYWSRSQHRKFSVLSAADFPDSSS